MIARHRCIGAWRIFSRWWVAVFTRWWAEVFDALGVCRGATFVCLVFLLAMIQDQTSEALRIVADPADPVAFFNLFFWSVCVLMLTFAVWVYALVTLRARVGVDPVINMQTNQVVAEWRVASPRDDGIAALLAATVPAAAALGLFLAVNYRADWDAAASADRTLFSFGIVFAVLALIVLATAGRLLFRNSLHAAVIEGREGDVPKGFILLAVVSLGVSALLFLGHAFFPTYPAPYVLVWWCGLLLAVLAGLSWVSRKLHVQFVPLLVLFAFAVGYLNLTDNHTVRHHWQASVCDPPPVAAQALADWLQLRGDRQKYQRYPVFVVAAEGGGMRAAYMTLKVLQSLQEANPTFSAHLFAVVGVSGGSVGAAMFAATGLTSDPAVASRSAATALGSDLLSPVLTGFLGPDLVARFWPNGWLGLSTDSLDRARWLEDALDDAWQAEGQHSLRSVSFQDAWKGVGGDSPALILLGTNVTQGHRLAVSHLRFDEGLRTLYDESPRLDVPLLTAAMISARFPLLTPAAAIPTPLGSKRVVDGGYFENSGVTTILEMRRALAPVLAREHAELYVLRIENGAATTAAGSWLFGKTGPANSFGELMSPLRAATATRTARGELAVADLLRVHPANRQALIALAPGPLPIPLGWWLSASARSDIDKQISNGGNADAFNFVRNALVATGPPTAPTVVMPPAQDVTPIGSRVALHAVADTWIDVCRPDGTLLVSRKLLRDQVWHVPPGPGLLLHTGDVQRLEILVDGQDVAALGRYTGAWADVPLDANRLRSGRLDGVKSRY